MPELSIVRVCFPPLADFPCPEHLAFNPRVKYGEGDYYVKLGALIWMEWIDREARRVRVKSIILSGHRKREWQWNEWLRWECMKSLFPALAVIPIHLFAFTIPNLLWALIVGLCLARVVFVLAHAGAVALRLNRRREAFLDAAGCDLTISSVLSDKNAWKVSRSGGTLRDFLKTRRPKS